MEEETAKGTQSKLTFALNVHVSSSCLMCPAQQSCTHSVIAYLCLYRCSGDAGWSSWTTGICTCVCGQNVTAMSKNATVSHSAAVERKPAQRIAPVLLANGW